MTNTTSLAKRLAAAGRRNSQRALTWVLLWLRGQLRSMSAYIATTLPRLQSFLRNLSPEWRLYWVAILRYMVALTIPQLTSGRVGTLVLQMTTAVSLSFFAIGFLVWLIRTILKFWKTGFGKLTIGLTNALLLLLSVLPARTIVSESLGLSPLDFDYTVGICAVLFYPVISLTLLFVALSIGYLVIALATVLPSSAWKFTDRAIGLVLRWVFSLPIREDPYIQIGSKSLWVVSVHLIGSLVLFLLVSILAIQAQNSWLKPVVRNVAYLTEYYYLPDYPGIRKDLPAKIHTNSVVSYARRKASWDVEIIVEFVKR